MFKNILAIAAVMTFLAVAPLDIFGQQILSLGGRDVSSMSSLPNGVYLTEENGVIVKVVVLNGKVVGFEAAIMAARSPARAPAFAHTLANGGSLAVTLSVNPTRLRRNQNAVMTVSSSVGSMLRSAIAGMRCDGVTPLDVYYKIELYKGDPKKISELAFQRSIICTPLPPRRRRAADPIYDVKLEDGSARRIVTPSLAPPAVVNLFDVKKELTINGTTVWGPGQDWPHVSLFQKWTLFARLEVRAEQRGNTLLSLSGETEGVKVVVFRK